MIKKIYIMTVVNFDPNKKWADYMVEGFRHLLDCDAIFLLPDWYLSPGARIEKAVAGTMDKTIFSEEEGHFA